MRSDLRGLAVAAAAYMQNLGAITFAVALALGVSAAAPAVAQSPNAAPSAPSAAGSLRDRLPDAIKKSGSIVLVTDASFGPPWNFHPGDDPAVFDGIDPTIAREIARRLGVEIKFVSTAFSGIIPALMTNRYDLAMIGMTATKERQRQIDQVTYVVDAYTIVVPAGNPKSIAGLQDLCGKTVAVVTGARNETIVTDFQPSCGKTPMDIQSFPAFSDTYLQVRSGRAAATLHGYASAFYQQAHKVAGVQGVEPLPNARVAEARLGIGVSKQNPQLRDAVVAALDQMMKDGAYQAILNTWNIGSGAVPKILVNPDL